MNPLNDLSRLCIHTITTKPWSFEMACEKYSSQGIAGITIWDDAIEGLSVREVNHILNDSGINLVSYCRGGFFASSSSVERKQSLENNERMLEKAASIQAPMVVYVCGSAVDQPLEESRIQIRDGLEHLLPLTEQYGIRMAIEPLHPMYADDRSAINTLRQANEMAEYFDSPYVGVAVDVYHLWWDPDLEEEIKRCGENENLFAFHVCDWKTPTTDILLDRGLMGEGCIAIKKIRSWVERAGFDGFYEVEIFSSHYWSMEQEEFLSKIIDAYKNFT